MSRPAREGGYVLLVVLFLLMAVTAMGHSLLVLSRSELLASRARWEALARRLIAEGGVRIAADGVGRAEALAVGEWLPTGEGTIEPRARYATRAMRLSPEIVLLRSEGSLESRPGAHAVLGLYWGMSPEVRVGAARAVVETGAGVALSGGSRIDVARIHEDPPPWSEDRCDPYRPGLDTLLATGVRPWAELAELPFAGSTPAPEAGGGATELPRLGLLDHEALMAGAGLRVAGTISPSPRRAADRCDRMSALNWGAPLDPLHPCASYRPVVSAEGALTMAGGAGQGVLLVAGDATLTAGARFFGVVLVSGNLTVQGGAEITGLLRVRGRVSLRGGAEVVGSVCAALDALEGAEALHGLVPLPEGAWLDDSG